MRRGGQGRRADAITRRGMMLVLSSPSGAGKTTLSRKLLKAHREIVMSVSVTTRPPRAGEVDGRDYHFIDVTRFEAMERGGDLLEWAHVFGHSYGSPRQPVDEAISFFSSEARLTERIRRPNFGSLDVDVAINDPKVFTKVWTVELHLKPMVDTEMIEYMCQDNNKDVQHFVR